MTQDLAIIGIGGLFLGWGWFSRKPYTDWKVRAIAGFVLGTIAGLAIQLLFATVIQFDVLAMYVASVVAGSLLVRGLEKIAPPVTGHSKIEVTPPPDAKPESAVALMLNELLQLEDDIRKLTQEVGSERTYYTRLQFCEDKRRDALRNLKRGQASEARKMLDTVKELYARELQEAQSTEENMKLFNEAVEQLSPDQKARILDKPKSNPYT